MHGKLRAWRTYHVEKLTWLYTQFVRLPLKLNGHNRSHCKPLVQTGSRSAGETCGTRPTIWDFHMLTLRAATPGLTLAGVNTFLQSGSSCMQKRQVFSSLHSATVDIMS